MLNYDAYKLNKAIGCIKDDMLIDGEIKKEIPHINALKRLEQLEKDFLNNVEKIAKEVGGLKSFTVSYMSPEAQRVLYKSYVPSIEKDTSNLIQERSGFLEEDAFNDKMSDANCLF